MTGGRLRVVFLIGRRTAPPELSIAEVCRPAGVEPVAVLVDTGGTTLGRRLHNLRRNLRREGPGYIVHRAVTGLRQFLERCAASVIDEQEVEALLEEAVPGRNLRQLSAMYGFEIFEVGSLNGPLAAEKLRSLGADLGVVLGTRVLKRPLFELPRLGCVNLHKGRVPE